MNAFIRLLYSLMIAASVVTFIVVAVYSFYQPPAQPDYPNYSYSANTTEEEYAKRSEEQEKIYEKHREKERGYYRNIAIAVTPTAAVIVVAGLWVLRLRRKEVIGEGIALGGLATAIYAIIAASIASHDALRFLAVTVLLAGALLLTYRRFVADDPQPAKKKR